jgi:hypothetical protein
MRHVSGAGGRARGGNDRRLAADVVKGATAGAVGVWLMDRVGWFLCRREDPAALRREREARVGGMDPAHVAAGRLVGALGIELAPS